MIEHRIEEIEVLLWNHPTGLSAYAAPWVFDLEYDETGRATVDATKTQVKDHPLCIDRYGVLGKPELASILKAGLRRRDEFGLDQSGAVEGYLVRRSHPGIDEAAFLKIVARFVQAWRRKNDPE